jgi:membrane protease YdiL (CAAX protease family)
MDALTSAPRPYGWIGLPVSLVAILVLASALGAGVVAAVFGVEVLRVGWPEAVTQASSLFQAMKGDPRASEFIALCLSILIYVSLAIVVVAVAHWRGGDQWRDLVAWHPWSLRRAPRAFWLIAGVTLAYSLVANEVLAFYYPASQDWVQLPSGAWSIALFFVVATVAAPLTEELIFRGWFYTGLRAKLPLWPSLLISSVLFALAHWESTHLYALVVFPVGLALGVIRERAGSLKASMIFHALYNATAFMMICLGH